MKGRQILLDALDGREAAALMVDGRLEDILIDDGASAHPGTIYRAICDRPLKGQGGMMMRLPGGTGFLRRAKGRAPGQPVLVQVTGYSEEGKAVPVTDRLLFKSRYVIVTPDAPGLNISRQIRDEDERLRLHDLAAEVALPEGAGLIVRSAAAGAEGAAILEDLAAMAGLCAQVLGDATGAAPECLAEGDGPHLLAWRDWSDSADVVTDPGCFDTHGVLDALEALKSPLHALSHGSMAVEPTRALVAVDVNTGGDTSQAAGLKANLAAMRDLPRALRLRGLGGQIVVDFAPMPKGQRRQIESAARAACRACPIEMSLIGWTPLGHLEFSRKRERLGLWQCWPEGLT